MNDCYQFFRCEKLPEDNQQDFYDYYAIDIGNSPAVVELITAVRSLIEEHGIYSISACDFLNTSIFLAKFPPCDPIMFKLLPMCITQCPTFSSVISQCFGDGLQTGVALSDFAAIYDSYNCSDISTYLPEVSADLFDSQAQCYNVSNYTLGKCVLIYLVITIRANILPLS